MTQSTQMKMTEELSFSSTIVGFMHLFTNEHLTQPQNLIHFIESCYEIGVTTFDHADIYGKYTCESFFGKALKEKPSLRDQMQLVTKCGIKTIAKNRPSHTIASYDTSKSHILQSVNNSLRELHTEYVDLVLIHRPDPLMNADEVASAFQQLKEEGKVKHFGVSNFLPFQFELLQNSLDFPLITNQLEFSVPEPKAILDGTLDQCQKLNIRPMAWSPLAGGSIFNAEDPKTKRIQTELHKIKDEIGAEGIDQVALAWILQHPSKVLPVLGSLKIQRIQSAVAAEKLQMSREQWFRIYEASNGHRVP